MHPIVAYRNKLGLSQIGLAQALGVAPSTICRLENGTRGCSSQAALELSEITGLPVDAFLLVKPGRLRRKKQRK